MNSRKALALVVVTVFLVIQQTHALTCWNCLGMIFETGETGGDEWCLDPFDHNNASKSSLEECDIGRVCGKFLLSHDILGIKGNSVKRSCAYPDICRVDPDFEDFTMTHCETCVTDGCNAEENPSSGFAIYPLIVLVTISTVNNATLV